MCGPTAPPPAQFLPLLPPPPLPLTSPPRERTGSAGSSAASSGATATHFPEPTPRHVLGRRHRTSHCGRADFHRGRNFGSDGPASAGPGTGAVLASRQREGAPPLSPRSAGRARRRVGPPVARFKFPSRGGGSKPAPLLYWCPRLCAVHRILCRRGRLGTCATVPPVLALPLHHAPPLIPYPAQKGGKVSAHPLGASSARPRLVPPRPPPRGRRGVHM